MIKKIRETSSTERRIESKPILGTSQARKSFYKPIDLEAGLNSFKEVMGTISVKE